jgi:hypothetical protein
VGAGRGARTAARHQHTRAYHARTHALGTLQRPHLARAGAARAPRALRGLHPADGHHVQAVHAAGCLVALELHHAAVHHIHHALDSDARLRHVGGHDAAPHRLLPLPLLLLLLLLLLGATRRRRRCW